MRTWLCARRRVLPIASRSLVHCWKTSSADSFIGSTLSASLAACFSDESIAATKWLYVWGASPAKSGRASVSSSSSAARERSLETVDSTCTVSMLESSTSTSLSVLFSSPPSRLQPERNAQGARNASRAGRYAGLIEFLRRGRRATSAVRRNDLEARLGRGPAGG